MTLGRCLECVPLKYARVQESELEYLLIEVLPHQEGGSIPFFVTEQQQQGQQQQQQGEGQQQGEEQQQSEQQEMEEEGSVSLQHCSCLFLKLSSHADHASLLAQLEGALWASRQQHRSMALL